LLLLHPNVPVTNVDSIETGYAMAIGAMGANVATNLEGTALRLFR